jgi:hypothetical protein
LGVLADDREGWRTARRARAVVQEDRAVVRAIGGTVSRFGGIDASVRGTVRGDGADGASDRGNASNLWAMPSGSRGNDRRDGAADSVNRADAATGWGLVPYAREPDFKRSADRQKPRLRRASRAQATAIAGNQQAFIREGWTPGAWAADTPGRRCFFPSYVIPLPAIHHTKRASVMPEKSRQTSCHRSCGVHQAGGAPLPLSSPLAV